MRLQIANREHLAAIASEAPSALVRRLHTSGGVAELLRWFAENADVLLAAPAPSPAPADAAHGPSSPPQSTSQDHRQENEIHA